MIDVSKYTAHKFSGKFENESPATEYFFNRLLDGDGEALEVYQNDAADNDDAIASADVFQIDSEEAEAFGLSVGHWYMLRHDDAGFVFGSTHESREAAMDKLTGWAGI